MTQFSYIFLFLYIVKNIDILVFSILYFLINIVIFFYQLVNLSARIIFVTTIHFNENRRFRDTFDAVLKN